MKKIITFTIIFILLITSIFTYLFLTNKNEKNNVYYFDNIIVAQMLNYSKSGNVEFKPVYPKNVDMHEYDFTQKDISNFENSKGVYYVENTEHNKLKNVKNKISINKNIEKYLLQNDNVNDIHYSLSITSQKEIYNKLVTLFKSNQDQNKVNYINKLFDNVILKVSKMKFKTNLVSVHPAWNYLIKNQGLQIKLIGNNDGSLNDNLETKNILNTKNKTYLLSEANDELTSNEQKVLKNQNISNIKVNTFEKELPNVETYFEQIQENYDNLKEN